ncbi:hypothetical protein ACFLZI_04030, partial [Nitrospirota bacterium]
RFPNFAFAYLLLFAIIGINLAGGRTAFKIQGVLVLITLLCLGILIIKGLIGFEQMPIDKKSFTPSLNPGLLALPMLLFIGFETAWIIEDDSRKSVIFALTIAGIFLAAWAMVSLMYVAPGKLSRTSIPFTITARNIFGQTGRYIIGVAAIAGSAAAVNAMLMGLKRITAGFSIEGAVIKYNIPVLAGGLGAGGIMLAGIAGEDELKTAIRAGLILWTLAYAFIGIAAFRAERKLNGLMGALILLAGIAVILFSSDEPTHLISIMSYAVTISIVICYGLHKLIIKEG